MSGKNTHWEKDDTLDKKDYLKKNERWIKKDMPKKD